VRTKRVGCVRRWGGEEEMEVRSCMAREEFDGVRMGAMVRVLNVSCVDLTGFARSFLLVVEVLCSISGLAWVCSLCHSLG
jgi:hypothetical protein